MRSLLAPTVTKPQDEGEQGQTTNNTHYDPDNNGCVRLARCGGRTSGGVAVVIRFWPGPIGCAILSHGHRPTKKSASILAE